jgi:MSHA biogenesis protein MshN
VVVRASNTVAADVDRAADLIARGRATEAMELLAQVLARQPTHAGVRSSLAALLAESGRREQALHVLLAGSEQDPVHFAAPAAQLQAELGDLAGALATLARVPQTRRSARDDALYAGIAQRTGDHMTAIAAYRRALAQPRPDAVWWVGLGVSLEAIGEAEDAAGAYARAAADARLSADVRRYVADRLAVLGAQGARTDEARKASLANVF